MINLTFITPYEDLQPVVDEVLREYKTDEEISVSTFVLKSWEVGKISFQGDVVISRGFTALQLRERYPKLVSVPLKVSGYDVIHTAQKAVKLYHPQKLAIIGSYLMVHDTENLNGVFETEIVSYPVDGYDAIPEAIAKAKEEGCDCFMGGLSLLRYCGENDRAVMIETGKSAVIQSIDEAVRLIRQTRVERNRAAGLRTIINHSPQGVIFLDESKILTAINETALRYLNAGESWIGRKCRDVFPFLGDLLDEVERTGAGLSNEIITVVGQLLAVDVIPTAPSRNAMGIIMFIKSVNRIQKDESLIRKKIHSKGLRAKYTFDDIIGGSDIFQKVLNQAYRFSQVECPILITGESGTGKELLAQSIHNAGPRRDGPFVAINCAALPENLLESELFGYSEGAFTGALKGGKPGLFELAHGGSIFLDEISEIPVSFQSKLLRVLQENEVRRIGDDKVLSIDIRVITATNRCLRDMTRRGSFRQDLLYRLDVLSISIPPLRERPEDIILLFSHYVTEFSRKYNKDAAFISGGAERLLEQYAWEGNVRELRNIAERICLLNNQRVISADAIREALPRPEAETFPSNSAGTEHHSEREALKLLIQQYRGNRRKIAEHLNINRSTLWRKLKKYQLES
ncbi:MAG: sigma 54-interacting transcriptional regulator [Treponema sp.]|jgi:transcriptional regulator with PAS, ATPase and Fis domain|nr:sigma 54-interacting transcriptional regulator [Treponema sp.]